MPLKWATAANPLVSLNFNLPDFDLTAAERLLSRAMELDSSESIVGLVMAGLGVGVVPSNRLRGESLTKLRTVPFGTPPVRRSVVLIERSNNQRSDLAAILYQELLSLTVSG